MLYNSSGLKRVMKEGDEEGKREGKVNEREGKEETECGDRYGIDGLLDSDL